MDKLNADTYIDNKNPSGAPCGASFDMMIM